MRSVVLIIPCFNEEGNLSLVNESIQSMISEKLAGQYKVDILFVNDGSKDNSLHEMKKLARGFSNVHYISLSRNFGHQNAIKAGIDHAKADAVITLDADKQHPPSFVTEMLKYWEKGYHVVNMKRIDANQTRWFKKMTSTMFYRLINVLSYVKIEPGTADFRLMDRKVVKELQQWNEHGLFFRGIVPWLGFKQCSIEFHPEERTIGATKYSVKRMFSFALTGITSFSIKPLRISMLFGAIISLLAGIYLLYVIYVSLFTDNAISGWASTMVSVLFIGGLQLLMLGIMGEYLGKLFLESKKRPNYIIEETNIEDAK